MSATFNVPLFANYFSSKSVAGVEAVESYKGTEQRYRDEEAKRLKEEAEQWGGVDQSVWDDLSQK